MKKRMMSLLLTLTMLLSLVPAFGTVASAEEHSHSYTNGICACGECDGTHSSDDGWKALYQSNINTAVSNATLESDKYYATLTADKYYLAEDVTLPAEKSSKQLFFRVSGDFSLCLNGHRLTAAQRTGSVTNAYIEATQADSTFTFYDCQETVDNDYYVHGNTIRNGSFYTEVSVTDNIGSNTATTIEDLVADGTPGSDFAGYKQAGSNNASTNGLYIALKGGFVSGITYDSFLRNFKKVTFNGGTFAGNKSRIVTNTEEIEINGGTFVGNVHIESNGMSSIYYETLQATKQITVNGGTIVANQKKCFMSAPSVTVNGGLIAGNDNDESTISCQHFTMTGGNISNNRNTFCNEVGENTISCQKLTMTGGNISDNLTGGSCIRIDTAYADPSDETRGCRITGGAIEGNRSEGGKAAILVRSAMEGYQFIVGGTAKIRRNSNMEKSIAFAGSYGMPYLTVENPQSGMEVALASGMEVHGGKVGDEQYFYVEGKYNTASPVTNKHVRMGKYGNLYVASGSAPAAGTGGSVTLHANDGALSAYTASSGSDYLVNYPTDSFTLPIPAKSGSYFEGWYEDSGFSGSAVTSAENGKTYYAKWSDIHTHLTEEHPIEVENYIKLTQADFSTSNTAAENFVYYNSNNHVFKLKSGHYWLSEDVTLPKDGDNTCNVQFTSEASFCLDGHVLDLNGGTIQVQANRVTFEDCKHDEDHKHYYTVSESTGLWTLEKNGDSYVTSGTGDNYITGGAITGSSIVVEVRFIGSYNGTYPSANDNSNFTFNEKNAALTFHNVNLVGNNNTDNYSGIIYMNPSSGGGILTLDGNTLIAGNVGAGVYINGPTNYNGAPYSSIALLDQATITENTRIYQYDTGLNGGGIIFQNYIKAMYLSGSAKVLGNYWRKADGGEKWDADICLYCSTSSSSKPAVTIYLDDVNDEPQYGFFSGYTSHEIYIEVKPSAELSSFEENMVDNMAPKNYHTKTGSYIVLNGHGSIVNNKPLYNMTSNHVYLYATMPGYQYRSVTGAPANAQLRLFAKPDIDNGYDLTDVTAGGSSILSTYDANSGSFSFTMPSGGGSITVDATVSQNAPTLIYHYNDGTTADKTAHYSNVLGCDTFETPTRSGYAFAGWYDNSGLTGTCVTSLPAGGGNKELYAKWSNPGTVALHTNGGTINSGNITQYPEGTATALPTDVTKPGVAFAGWYDNEGLTGSAVTEIPASASGAKEYWAKWGYTCYNITNGTPEANAATNHGYITVVPTADYEAFVDVTVMPAAGYRLSSLSYTGATSGKVKITNISNGVATFTMPAEAVTLKASFKSGTGIDFRYPVYVDNDVSKGIDHWEDDVCETATQAYISSGNLGTAGEDTWYYTTTQTYAYNNNPVTVQGNVHLILSDGTTATFSKGIKVSGDGNSLTIYGQTNDTGKLIATGGPNAAAGIGGQISAGGNIVINGGVIEATPGGNNAAGIGGGGNNWGGSSIVINGGTVTATGGANAAGIGGGNSAAGSYITINGGIITATGGTNGGAGIGGGNSAAGSHITINGGIITATGGTNAAGIGGGNGGSASVASDNITVDTGLLIKAGTSANPTASVLTERSADADIATESDFLKQYVTVEPNVSGYTVSFNANGGSGSMTAVSPTSAVYTLPDCAFTAPAHKKFDGWSLTQGGAKITTSSIVLTGNTTLFARWKNVDYYTVTWNNYDNSTIKTETLAEGTTPAYTGATPTRTGNAYVVYTFTGWSKELEPVYEDIAFTAQYYAAKTPVAYQAPVYVQNKAEKGIDYWKTKYCMDYTLISSTDETWGTIVNDTWYILTENVSLSNAVTVRGNVNLILTDNCTLTATNGIVVPSGISLTIYSTSLGDNMGKIVAVGNNAKQAAGIGGYNDGNNTINRSSGSITINGGDITATGGYISNVGGAGIGGGYTGTGSNITINAGKITATGQYGGAGIGGGYGKAGSNITFNGGTVNATGSYGGAGIGGGYGAAGSNITFNGGTVTATGSLYNNDYRYPSAGIGGGYNNAGSNITFNGGTVTATAGYSGADAIGSGIYSSTAASAIKVSNNLTIKAGTAANPTALVLTDRAADADIATDTNFKKQYVTITPSNTYTVTFHGNGLAGSMAAESGVYGRYALPITTTFTIPSGKELKGWSLTQGGALITTPSIIVNSNTDLYAVWDTATYYTVTWLNGDGSTLKQDQWMRNEFPTCPSTLPAKASVGALDYVFSGWSPEVGLVSGDITYTPTFTGASNRGVVYRTPVYKTANTPSSGLDYMDYAACANADCTIISNSTITTATTWGEAGTNSWYVIDGTVTYSNTLTIAGNVYLILKDTCQLYAYSGICVSDPNSLTIYAQSFGEKMGKMVAAGYKGTNSSGSAGIGGLNDGNNTINRSNGIITINGGDITATGSYGGAGIGGSYIGSGSNITINGGRVTATGNSGGAGIGGGANRGVGSNIIINGGTVTANGSSFYSYSTSIGGAGIGGGENGSGSYITITGGRVTATGASGAGIGGGHTAEASYITITGGTVTANGGEYAAGIGGSSKAGSNITIKGGTVTANGGKYAAGIGGGLNASGSNISITGGTVTAIGGENSSGIGSGNTGAAASNIDVSAELRVKAGDTAANKTVKPDSDTEYSANLTGKRYVTITLKTIFVVSFDANGGSGEMADVEDIVGSYTLPANGFTCSNPSDEEFKGWSLTADGAVINTESIDVDKDIVLYAKWGDIILHYDITFKNYDGSTLDVYSIGTDSVAAYSGATPIKPSNDNYDYVFTGWSPALTQVTGEATYTAQYKPVLKVGPAFNSVKYTVSLVLGEKIDMQLTIKNVPSGFDASALTVMVTPEGETGKQISVSKDNSGNYVGIMYSAKPTEMSKLLTCTVTYNGVQARNPFNYSVLTYCTNKLKAGSGASNNLKALCKAMLNYGAWAQLQFNEATDNLANKNLEAADKLVYSTDFDTKIVTPSVTSPVLPEGIDNISATLILNEETTVKFYLETSQALKVSDVSIKSDKVGEIGLTMERDEANNCYVVTIPKIGAHRLGYLFTVTVKGVEFNYGPYSYCKAVNSTASGEEITETLKTLGMAIYNYGEAAKAYRANPNG